MSIPLTEKLKFPSPARAAGQALAKTAAKSSEHGPMFRSFHAVTVDDKVFPPVTEPVELRLPALDTHFSGPAPVAFGALALRQASASQLAQLEHLWLAGFLDAQKRNDGASRQKKQHMQKQLLSRYDAEDSRNLLDASADFKRLMDSFRRAHVATDSKKMSAHAAAAMKLVYNPITKENARIKRILMGNRRGAGSMLAMRSEGVDRLVLIERLEVQAAIVIQRFWRRELRRRFWKRFIEENTAVINIQRVFKSYLERRRAMEYLRKARKVALFAQAWWRGKTCREHVREENLFYHWAAVDIQRLFRGFAVRHGLRNTERIAAATKIQSFWRGTLARGLADRLWLDRKVTLIQKNVRRYLVGRKYQRELQMAVKAATVLQSCIRGWLGRRIRDRRLWDRETQKNKDFLHVLSAEIEWAEREADELQKVSRFHEVHEEITTLSAAWNNACNLIQEQEYDFLHLQASMRLKVDDLALINEVSGERQEITASKSKALFEIALPLRTFQRERESTNLRVEHLTYCRQRALDNFAFCRAYAFKRERMMETATLKKEMDLGAAAEKRKWEITPVTSTGKPDVQRMQLLNKIRQSQMRGYKDEQGVASSFMSLSAVDVMMMFRNEETYEDYGSLEASHRQQQAVRSLENKMRQTILQIAQLPSAYLTDAGQDFVPQEGGEVLADRAAAHSSGLLRLDDRPATSQVTQGGSSQLVQDALKDLVDFEHFRQDDDQRIEEKTHLLPLSKGSRHALKSVGRRRPLHEMARDLRKRFGSSTENVESTNEDIFQNNPTDEMLSAAVMATAAATLDPDPELQERIARVLGETVQRSDQTVIGDTPVTDAVASTVKPAITKLDKLINDVGVLNTQAEMRQYGALMKPLMDGVTRMMMHTMASDATAGAVQIALNNAVVHNAEIDEKISDLHELRQRNRERSRIPDETPRRGPTHYSLLHHDSDADARDDDSVMSVAAFSEAGSIDSSILASSRVDHTSETHRPAGEMKVLPLQKKRAQEEARSKFWKTFVTKSQNRNDASVVAESADNLDASPPPRSPVRAALRIITKKL